MPQISPIYWINISIPRPLGALKTLHYLTYLFPENEHEVGLPINEYRTEKLRFVFSSKAIRQQKRTRVRAYNKRALVKSCTKRAISQTETVTNNGTHMLAMPSATRT